MRCVRALPTIELMSAAGSCDFPVAIAHCWIDFPERLSGRTPHEPALRAPQPSLCRRTDVRGPGGYGL